MKRFHFTSSLGLQRAGSGNKITQEAVTLRFSFPLMVGKKHAVIENVVMGFFSPKSFFLNLTYNYVIIHKFARFFLFSMN